MWQYCPLCSGQLSNHNSELHGICSKCGQHWYKNPKPTASAIIVRKNSILLVKRNIQPRQNTWDTPGGYMLENELPEDTVKRELQEELNIEPLNLELFAILGPTNYNFQHIISKNLDFFYLATIADDANIKPGDDAEEFGWFNLNKKFPEISFPSVKQAIQLAKEKLTSH